QTVTFEDTAGSFHVATAAIRSYRHQAVDSCRLATAATPKETIFSTLPIYLFNRKPTQWMQSQQSREVWSLPI
ncbi:MAG: hypothetical protein KDA51_05270, partial [Planctomycetales bacterium]|nr:hypothetical protein [Planctomycetales bacterium]